MTNNEVAQLPQAGFAFGKVPQLDQVAPTGWSVVANLQAELRAKKAAGATLEQGGDLLVKTGVNRPFHIAQGDFLAKRTKLRDIVSGNWSGSQP